MDIHLLTPQGDQLVAQVVDGRVIVPPAPILPPEPASSADQLRGGVAAGSARA